MALNSLPDFSYKGGVPNELVAAYQNKAAIEDQMRMNAFKIQEQKYQDVANMFNSGAQLVSALVERSKMKQQQEAQQSLVGLLASGADQVPTETMKPAASSMVPNLTQAPATQDYSTTPGYKAELAALATKAFPEEAGKELAKSVFGQMNPKIGTLSGRDIQQKNYILPDGTRASVHIFETKPSGVYGTPFTIVDTSGNEMDPSMLQGAIEAPTPGIGVDQFGNPIIIEKVGAGSARRVPTSTPTETPEPIQNVDPENAFLRLSQKAPKIAESVKQSVEKTSINNPAVQAKVESINASKYAKGILADPKAKETELRSVYTYIARAVEKGALTEADKQAFSEPLSILARGENFFTKHLKGDAGKKFKSSLIRLQTRLEQRGTAELQRKIASEKMMMKKQAGKTWEPGLDSLYPTVEELTIQGTDMNPDQAGADDLGDGFTFKVR